MKNFKEFTISTTKLTYPIITKLPVNPVIWFISWLVNTALKILLALQPPFMF